MLFPRDKVILDLCGGTGSWSAPYREAGYDVRVITSPLHDVRLFPSTPSSTPRLPDEFSSIEDLPPIYGILAAPPCTVFSWSGNAWPRTDAEIHQGLALVDSCIRLVHVLRPKFWCLENPVGKLRKWLGPPKMSFHPCDYGDPYKKITLLWGDFRLPIITNPVPPQIPSPLHQNLSKKDRAARRSVTPPGFARAFFKANM